MPWIRWSGGSNGWMLLLPWWGFNLDLQNGEDLKERMHYLQIDDDDGFECCDLCVVFLSLLIFSIFFLFSCLDLLFVLLASKRWGGTVGTG
jgi:hypothetical protein